MICSSRKVNLSVPLSQLPVKQRRYWLRLAEFSAVSSNR